MQLLDRGIPYEKTSLIFEIREGEIGGKYGGREFNHLYPRHIPQMKPKFGLQYGGVAYSTIATPVEKSSCFVAQNIQNIHNICPVSVRKQIKIEDNLSQVYWKNPKRDSTSSVRSPTSL